MKRWLTFLFVCFVCLMAHDALARGGGGCFEQGTPVLIPHGSAPIEQLQVGDEVKEGRVAAVYRVEPTEYLAVFMSRQSIPFKLHRVSSVSRSASFRMCRVCLLQSLPITS